MKTFKELVEKKESKSELKEKAQSELLIAMTFAFAKPENKNLIKIMDKEMKRAEKLFGFVPGSFIRG